MPSTVTTEPSQLLDPAAALRGWCLPAFTSCLAGGYLWIVHSALPWHQEQQIVGQIKRWGGNVETKTTGPEWLRRLVGDETNTLKRRKKSFNGSSRSK